MFDFWVTEYRYTAVTVRTQASELAKPVQNSFLKWHQAKKATTDQDEYSKYLLAPVISELQIHGPGGLNLRSARPTQTLELCPWIYYLIPAMSAEPERPFSGAKITTTGRWNRLGIKSIEAINVSNNGLVKAVQ